MLSPVNEKLATGGSESFLQSDTSIVIESRIKAKEILFFIRLIYNKNLKIFLIRSKRCIIV